VAAVQDENFMVVLHNAVIRKTRSHHASTGAQGFHFGNAVNMMDILPQIPEHILAFGNLAPAMVFKQGTPEEVKAKTRRYSSVCPTTGILCFLQAAIYHLGHRRAA